MISYHPIDKCNPGESWRKENIEENYSLCNFQPSLQTINRYLFKSDRILDIGCGYGRCVKYFCSLGYDVVGVDLSQDAINVAKKYGLDVSCGDACDLSYDNESFDAIFCFGVIEHIESGAKQPLLEFYRLLSDGGRLFISIPTQNIIRRVVVNLLKTIYRYFRILLGIKFRFEEYRYSRREFRKILCCSGLKIIEEIPDEFLSPKNIGLWVDFPFLRGDSMWTLNKCGVVIRNILDFISPWISNGSTLWICMK